VLLKEILKGWNRHNPVGAEPVAAEDEPHAYLKIRAAPVNRQLAIVKSLSLQARLGQASEPKRNDGAKRRCVRQLL
jgi:hypothetical protein